MAAPTNTLISNNAVGNRESLHNIISILNKDETPFQAAIGSGSAEATYEEWQLDALGNADTTNAQPEGDDTTAAAIVPTSRVGNRTQILKKPFTISATQEVVKKAGRDSEISYQTALAGRRIKMDLEAIACLQPASGKLGWCHRFAVVLDHDAPWQELLRDEEFFDRTRQRRREFPSVRDDARRVHARSPLTTRPLMSVSRKSRPAWR